MRWGNSGGLPVIALAPVDVKDCYLLTAQAFNLAEKYRCPVFIASNKEVSLTRETIDLDQLKLPKIISRKIAPDHKPYLPFAPSEGTLTPDFLPMGGDRLSRQTSSTHGRDGYITTDPDLIAENLERLRRKLLGSVPEFTYYDEYLEPDAAALLITYGVTARAAKSAVREMNQRGRPISLLVLKTLWPVPQALIKTKAAPHPRIYVCEMNLGQYVREIERVLPDKPIQFLGQMNGELITPNRIAEWLDHD
jgi:2-oxoglutarate/2-oxoacid ferredoxin oxidoreductase subunit alpha